MKSYSTTEHSLEISERGSVFRRPLAGMFRLAIEMASYGNIDQSLERSHQIYIDNYGHMGTTKFRVVTKTTTIHYQSGNIEEFIDQ